jgi:hypothetical protein
MPQATKPFVVEHSRQEEDASGYWKPGAGVRITPALRESGLLHALPPEDLKVLLLMLTFVTANGWIRPSAEQMARAMRVSPARARLRLAHLVSFEWEGEPVARETEHGGGLVTYSPSRAVLGSEEAPPMPARSSQPPTRTAAREEVIAQSRLRYARPRSEVEYEMALRQGWPLPGEPGASVTEPPVPEDSETAEVRRRLEGVGMPREHAELLLNQYPLDRIRRQLDFLPFRKARDRARYLFAAVKGDYDPPRGLPAFLAAPPVSPPDDRAASGDTPDDISVADAGGDRG